MLIDSSSFNGRRQHPDWYEGFTVQRINGFPTNAECNAFLSGLTHMIICETPMNQHLVGAANYRGVKVFLQANYEFLDLLKDATLPQPYRLVAPSPWHLDDLQARFGAGNVVLAPPPTIADDFASAWETNRTRRGRRRFLHPVGQPAVHDRNGTLSLLAALQGSKQDYELVIKSQKPLGHQTDDPRVTFDFSDASDQAELFIVM
jgi:hypothetical protein